MKKLLIILIILLVIQLPWFAALIRCEIDTKQHGEELIDAYKGYSEVEYWTDGYDWAKVIKYTENYAEVYYINEWDTGSYGRLIVYKFIDDKWIPQGGCHIVWTRAGGNADSFVWPYWYHSPWGGEYRKKYRDMGYFSNN